MLVFFFSSRRRHTRCSRDWSSDVCSSDLRQRPLSSVEVKKSTVNRIVCSGNEGGLVRAQKQSKRRYFLGFSHAAYRLGLRESPEHFLFTAGIIPFQIAVDEGRVHARRWNEIRRA